MLEVAERLETRGYYIFIQIHSKIAMKNENSWKQYIEKAEYLISAGYVKDLTLRELCLQLELNAKG